MEKEKIGYWRKLVVLAVLPLLSLLYVTSAEANTVLLDPIDEASISDLSVASGKKDKRKEALFILDGRIASLTACRFIDRNEIISMVIKRGKSIDPEFKGKGIESAVYVTTKTAGNPLTLNGEKGNVIQINVAGKNSRVLYFLDGKEITKAELDEMDTKKIKSMRVYNGVEPDKDKEGVLVR